MKFVAYLRKNHTLFLKSMRKHDFFISFLSDISVVALFFILYYAIVLPLNETVENLQSELTGGNLSADALAALESTLYTSVALFVLFLFLVSVSIISSRLFMWRRIFKVKSPSELKKRVFTRYIKHYFSSIFLLLIFLIVPVLVIIVNISGMSNLQNDPERLYAISAIFILMVAALLHIFTIFNNIFAKTSKAWYSIKNSFVVGIFQIKYYLLPYAVFALIVYLLGLILPLIGSILPLNVYRFAYYGSYLLIFTIARLYLGKLNAILYKKTLKESQ